MDEEFEQLTMECTNCHLQFYASDLKVNAASNLVVCVNCYNSPGGKVKVLKDRPLPMKKTFVPESPIFISPQESLPKAKEPAISVPEGFTLFLCSKCNYLFKRKNDYQRGCPYCSHTNLRVIKKN